MKTNFHFPTQYLKVPQCALNKLTTRYGSNMYLGETPVILKGTVLYFAVSFWSEVYELHSARINIKELLIKLEPFKNYFNGQAVLSKIASGITSHDAKFKALLNK